MVLSFILIQNRQYVHPPSQFQMSAADQSTIEVKPALRNGTLPTTTKRKYRLPTEAEWELACRAGVEGPWKIDRAELDKSAWYAGNSKQVTHPVGTKLPNKYGLYDMLGNVGEWAIDVNGKPVVCGGTFLDPADAIGPESRRRWTPKWQEEDPQLPKSRWWLSNAPFAGFRLVCEP